MVLKGRVSPFFPPWSKVSGKVAAASLGKNKNDSHPGSTYPRSQTQPYSWMANTGANVSVIRSALNHKDVNATLTVYARANQDAELQHVKLLTTQ